MKDETLAARSWTLRAAREDDVGFLLELRRLTMDPHHAAADIVQSAEVALARVRACLDVAQVVEVQGRPVGMIKVAGEPQALRIVQLQLLPPMQGQGIGAALVSQVLQRARCLYDRLGFRVVGRDEHSLHMQAGD